MTGRPAVSVIVPFAGTRADAERLVASLRRLRLGDSDELIVVDNSPVACVRPAGAAKVVRADAMRSSYYARNVGAEAARAGWLLFLDADVRPIEDLLDRYFDPSPAEAAGVVAGEVLGSPDQRALPARYARSRRHLVQEDILARPSYRPMAVTANLLVRRRAWEELGGFHEGVASGGDADFSWRLQDAGWRIEHRAGARVDHMHRESVRALARQAARIGAGRAWLGRRHPDFRFPNPLPLLARCVAGVLVWTLALQFERAAFKALDAVWLSAESIGYLLSNARDSGAAPPSLGRTVAYVLDEFPALTETFVLAELRALSRAGVAVRVEAAARPGRANRGGARGLPVSCWEDDGILRKLAETARLVARRPGAVGRDLRDRRRWRREETVWPLRSLAPAAHRVSGAGDRHLHVHFAGGAALNAMRLARLTGVGYSVTAHAYDVFQSPANLAEKLRGAAFAAGESEYTTRHLREVVGASRADRVHHLPSAVEVDRFRRRRPYPGGRCVVAVGRLIEKKGFAYLIEAAGILRDAAPLERVVIVGDGPLHAELRARARRAGVEDTVELVGVLQHAGVPELLEQADVVAMPSVVAADGDRDSLPNVVYEALAMEVPVVATDEVGLPEVIRPQWGRLVPPRDAAALAAGLEEVLALPPEMRARMGQAGRRFVARERNPAREAARLAALIEAAAG